MRIRHAFVCMAIASGMFFFSYGPSQAEQSSSGTHPKESDRSMSSGKSVADSGHQELREQHGDSPRCGGPAPELDTDKSGSTMGRESGGKSGSTKAMGQEQSSKGKASSGRSNPGDAPSKGKQQ